MADELDLSEVVRRTVEANVKFYQGWLDLSLEYLRGISGIFVASAAPVDSRGAVGVPGRDGVLVFEGEAGATVRSAFLVTNDLERDVSCTLQTSEFRDPDGAAVAAKVVFQPAKLELEPGQQQVVQADVSIQRELAAGIGYQGEFSIKGMDGFSVPVVLRRQHQVDAETGEEAKPDAAPGAAGRTPAKASRKKADRRKVSRKATSRRKRVARQKQ